MIIEYFIFDSYNPKLPNNRGFSIFQACRGDKVDMGVQLKPKTSVDTTKREERFISIPVMADILVMYSTVEGNKNYSFLVRLYISVSYPTNG